VKSVSSESGAPLIIWTSHAQRMIAKHGRMTARLQTTLPDWQCECALSRHASTVMPMLTHRHNPCLQRFGKVTHRVRNEEMVPSL
jgi:hypothetical protein